VAPGLFGEIQVYSRLRILHGFIVGGVTPWAPRVYDRISAEVDSFAVGRPRSGAPTSEPLPNSSFCGQIMPNRYNAQHPLRYVVLPAPL